MVGYDSYVECFVHYYYDDDVCTVCVCAAYGSFHSEIIQKLCYLNKVSVMCARCGLGACDDDDDKRE